MFNKNVGNKDKVVRIALAALLLIFYFTGTVSGTIGYIALIAAGALIITSLFSFCGLYAIFGISTCAVSHDHHASKQD